MEKKETLRQYLTYNKDINEIDQIFINLDSQLKYLHKNGYYVSELNSDTILLETSKYSSFNNQSVFMFSNILRTKDKSKDFANNIVDLSKLAIGAFISTENGFCDYSKISTEYIKKYFDEIAFYLPNSEYFRNVIMNSDTSNYYSDYVNMTTSNSKSNSIQKKKSTEYGKMYTAEDESAFVQLVFYPVIIISVITIIAVLSKILG